MKLSELKTEITSMLRERSINAISKLQQDNLDKISKALDFYKKNKHTDKREPFIKLLKKLGDEKKRLAKELDMKVSGMYKDAEYKGESVVNESVVNEMAMGFDTMTGLFYLKGVPFTRERMKEVIFFMRDSKVKSAVNQFEYTPALTIKDKVGKKEVTIDSKNLKTLIEFWKRDSARLASDKDFK